MLAFYEVLLISRRISTLVSALSGLMKYRMSRDCESLLVVVLYRLSFIFDSRILQL